MSWMQAQTEEKVAALKAKLSTMNLGEAEKESEATAEAEPEASVSDE